MWILILTFTVCAKVTLGEISCSEEWYNLCEPPDLFEGIPVSPGEFANMCPQLLTYIKCLKEYEDACKEANFSFFTKEEYEGMVSAFSELCDPESLLNAVVVDHLQCLNETFSNTLCVEESEVSLVNYKEPISDTPIEEGFKIPSHIYCLRDILITSCIVNDISKNCGELMKGATLEILRGSLYLQQSCSFSDAKRILDQMDDFELKQRTKDYVIEVLSKLIETQFTAPYFSEMLE
ncbi:UNVERIFIED_CONTAM: hypothetical protein NCL1_46481 [Trichonephila clavipes]